MMDLGSFIETGEMLLGGHTVLSIREAIGDLQTRNASKGGRRSICALNTRVRVLSESRHEDERAPKQMESLGNN